jgi:hypothetical protein
MLFGISFKETGLGKREWEKGQPAGILRDLNCNRILSNHNVGDIKKTKALGGPECLDVRRHCEKWVIGRLQLWV